MKSSHGRWRLATAALAATIPFVAAQSQAEPATTELQQRIEELSQKLLVLERKLEIKEEAGRAVVTLTDTHLTHGIGEALRHAYHGELNTHYTDEGDLLRAAWSR